MKRIALLALLPLTACLTPGDQPTSEDWETAAFCLGGLSQDATWTRDTLNRCLTQGMAFRTSYGDPYRAVGTKNPQILSGVMAMYDSNPDFQKCLADNSMRPGGIIEIADWYCAK